MSPPPASIPRPVSFWQGFGGHFDVVSAAIALGAAVALFRFQRNVVQVLAASAQFTGRAPSSALSTPGAMPIR